MWPDNYLMEAYGPSYAELKDIYGKYFSLGYLNTDVQHKFAVISLVCYLTMKAKQQKPDVTHYKVLMQLTAKNPLPDDFIKGLSIICDDFAYGCTEFPTFGIKTPGEMAKQVQSILSEYLPF